MLRQTRRIVTDHDDSGKAIVLMDSPALNVKARAVGGVTATLLWVTHQAPVQLTRGEDPTTDHTGVPPPASGSIFRIVDFLPSKDCEPVDSAAMLEGMGLPPQNKLPSGQHPSMHRTRSIDYALVLEGEIDMLLDDSLVHLKSGDVLIQKATNHAWVNNSDRPCRIAFILIDAVEPSAWKQPSDNSNH